MWQHRTTDKQNLMTVTFISVLRDVREVFACHPHDLDSNPTITNIFCIFHLKLLHLVCNSTLILHVKNVKKEREGLSFTILM